MPVQTVTDVSQFSSKNKCAVLFVASFHEACKPGGQMDTVFSHLCDKLSAKSDVKFYKVDAEELSDLAEQFAVEVVPTVALIVDGKVMDKIEGAHPAKVTEALERFAASKSDKSEAGSATPLVKRIEDLLASSYVFLFMKGNPENPKCKFSRKILELLKEAKVTDFGTFDILTDDAMRQGLKDYANWPTFPQLYAGGKLIGGVDIAEELQKEGELLAALTPSVKEVVVSAPVITPKQTLEQKLESLINQAPVMVFMKGSPEEPRCGFSAQLVKVLNETGVGYGHFDILTDDKVRQGLKTYSDWPTYPQVYVKGKLIGGLDIVRELAEDGELANTLSANL